jgi:tRNA/rRNA methyltransferase
MPFHTYLLRCSDGSYYVGHTDDLSTRIPQHESGLIPGYTQSRLPVALMWSQDFPERDQAFAAERQIKGWSRAKKEALIAGDYDLLRTLSRRILRDEASASSASPQDERVVEGSDIGAQPYPPPRHRPRPPAARREYRQGGARDAQFRADRAAPRVPARRLAQSRRPGPPRRAPTACLEQAQLYETVADAVADCAHVFATTVRKRGVTKPVVTARRGGRRDPRRPRPHRRSCSGPSDRGWRPTTSRSRARSSPCRSIPNSAALNLAQAVILVAYEWSKAEGAGRNRRRPISAPLRRRPNSTA